MNSYCGADCLSCENKINNKCSGCINSDGCPFGKKCFIANYIQIGGKKSFEELKNILIKEINDLKVDGMPKINELVALNGFFVNMKYNIEDNNIKFLDDDAIYLGTQVECIYNDRNIKKCFGIVCNLSFIIICEYFNESDSAELIIYKKR